MSTRIHVGIDEAGYGPTLGPLVISAAALRVPASEAPPGEIPDLWSLLDDVVTRKPDRSRVPVDDSKKLYRPGKGLGHLEEGLLPFLLLTNPELPSGFRELLARLDPRESPCAYLDLYPWYAGRELELPTKAFPAYLKKLARELAEALRQRDLEFLHLASLPIEVAQFNQTLEREGNKARVPFEAIGSLLRRTWKTWPSETVDVVVDRQGGRIQYAPLLFQELAPRGIVIDEETPEASIYRLRSREGAGELRVMFTRQGDAKSFPVALASMASKYLRELHMELFNGYWTQKLADLRPTAGYPGDARRFLEETARLRQELGTPESLLIRRR